MKNQILIFLFILSITVVSCSTDSEKEETGNPENKEAYFPPIGSNDWETISLEELKWNRSAVQPLLDIL